MGQARVLILRHSCLCRFRDHVTSFQDNWYDAKFGILTLQLFCKWHGVGIERMPKLLNMIWVS